MKILLLIVFFSSMAFGVKSLDSISAISCSVDTAMTAVTVCVINGKMDYDSDMGIQQAQIAKLDHVLSGAEQTDMDALLSTLKAELKTQEGIP